MAKKTSDKAKKADAPKKKKTVKANVGSHRETTDGAWAEAPDAPVVVKAEGAVMVESVVMNRLQKKEKRPQFMADVKI